MTVVDIVVVVAAVAAIAALGWFFFGPRRARIAQLHDGVRRVAVTVRGGYSPDVIKVRQGVPVEMVFDRHETGDCTSHVVFPDLQLSAATPAYQRSYIWCQRIEELHNADNYAPWQRCGADRQTPSDRALFGHAPWD